VTSYQQWPGDQYPPGHQPQGYQPPGYQYPAPGYQYPQGYQYPYPPGTQGPGGPYQPYQPPQSVGGLAVALRVLLIFSLLVSLGQIYGWQREFVLVGQVQSDPGSVSLATAQAADNLVNVLNGLWLLLYLAIAVVFLIWFYRVRQNAGGYGSYRQRHSQGWSIGGWFCPVLSLIYPYQMMCDVLRASETGPGVAPRQQKSLAVVALWWASWLAANVLALIGRALTDPKDINSLRPRATVEILSAVVEALATVLVLLVIARISTAQEQRRFSQY
jgi:hypothetical protein